MKTGLMACGLVVLALAFGCGGNVVVSGGTGGAGANGGGGAGGTGANGGGGTTTVTSTLNACDKYVADLIQIYTSCGINVGSGAGGGPASCTDAVAKQATCLDGCLVDLDPSTCPCLKDPTGADCGNKLKPYTDCTQTCIK